MSLRLPTLIAGAILLCGAIGNAQSPTSQSTAPTASKASKESGERLIVLTRDSDYFEIAPAYTLLVYADGRVVYIGTKNVKTKGTVEGRISAEDVQRLVKAFERINYFSLLDEYSHKGGCPFYMFDGPAAHTSIRIGDKKKAIFHDSGCMSDEKANAYFPPGLTWLENLIDEVVKSDQWIK